jgi:uncharacterized protein YbjT (DUF2867 family)
MSSTNLKSILVVGATGQQGGGVVSALQSSGLLGTKFNIIALTRSKSSKGAQALASNPHITLVEGDLKDSSAIFNQIGPVWGVFSVQQNVPGEEEQGKAVIHASVQAGVSHFVYASGDRGGPYQSDIDPTNVANFRAKYMIEKYLMKQAAVSTQEMTYTILRPVTFFENLSTDKGIHAKGFARMWEQIGKPLQMIAIRDIGWFATEAFDNPSDERFHNAALSLAGAEISQKDGDVIFKDAMGYNMPIAFCPIGTAVKMIKKETVGDMFQWFHDVGYGANVHQCWDMNPKMTDFSTWVKECSGHHRK